MIATMVHKTVVTPTTGNTPIIIPQAKPRLTFSGDIPCRSNRTIGSAMRLLKKPLPFMHITCSASHFRISVRLKKFNLIMLLIFETLLELKYRKFIFNKHLKMLSGRFRIFMIQGVIRTCKGYQLMVAFRQCRHSLLIALFAPKRWQHPHSTDKCDSKMNAT